ncbi:MAG: c-type cytochrome [Thermoanaerobaculia bacterium]
MREMRPFDRFAAVLAVLAFTLTGCDGFGTKDPGERVFRASCAQCHGIDGSGNTPLYMSNDWADLTDNSWRQFGDDATLETIIREGVFGEMPAHNELTHEEMRALLGYLHKLRSDRSE